MAALIFFVAKKPAIEFQSKKVEEVVGCLDKFVKHSVCAVSGKVL